MNTSRNLKVMYSLINNKEDDSIMNILKSEIQKAIINKFFFISISIGIAITIFTLYKSVVAYNETITSLNEYYNSTGIKANSHLGITSVFRVWIGGNSDTIYPMIFFHVLPLLASLPYS